MKRVVVLVGLCLLIITPLLTGCGQTKIRVGAGMAPERLLLTQMIILILEENGYKVIDMTPTGSTEETWRALINKDIDICPEYTGNYGRLVNELGDENKNAIVWLKPAPANNKWGIAITEELSGSCSENITTITQFRDYITNEKTDYKGEKKEVKLICSPEFLSNPEALPKFERKYDFTFPRDSDHLKIFPSSNTAYLAEMAVKDNTINAFMVYTTDAHLGKYGMVLLKDNEEAQSDFHPAPIMLREYYEKKLDKDKINRILTPLFTSLDDETLRELNSKIGVSGNQAISEVARQYLIENGYFKYNEFEMIQNAMDEMMFQNAVEKLWDDSTNEKEISDMSDFPPKKDDKDDKDDKLYDEENIVQEYIDDNTTWSYITWKNTVGTYKCDSEGRVKQLETGW